jgi:hypothetical protein
MVIPDDAIEAARLTGRRFRQKSNPRERERESEVHAMSAEPSNTNPPIEEASDERREAR